MDRVADPADPLRCQGATPVGQCWNKCEPGIDHCKNHAGLRVDVAQLEAIRLYKLAEVRRRDMPTRLTGNNLVNTLKRTLALARLLVEKCHNLSQTRPDLFRDYSVINTLQLTCKRLALSWTKLEQSLSTLKGKPEIVRAGRLIVQVCHNELAAVADGEEIVRRIAQQINEAIITATNNPELLTVKVTTALLLPADDKVFEIADHSDQRRLAELSSNSNLRSLAEDIALQVGYIEEIWNNADSDEQLVRQARAINDHFKVLEKLTASSHEMEEIIGNLLSATTRRTLGRRVSEILVEELNKLDGYEDIVDNIWTQAELGFKQVAADKRIENS